MNLLDEKLEIIRMLLNTNDKRLIQEVKTVFKSREADWWNEMSGEQKETILKGIAQADQDQTVPHEEAVKMFGQWGLK